MASKKNEAFKNQIIFLTNKEYDELCEKAIKFDALLLLLGKIGKPYDFHINLPIKKDSSWLNLTDYLINKKN